MLFTSGSTGEPKGVMVGHHGIAVPIRAGFEDAPPDAGSCAMLKTSISHSPFLSELLGPLFCGCHLVIARPGGYENAGYLRDQVIRERLTHLSFTPSLLRAFLEQPGIESCHSPRWVDASGEALSEDLRRRFFARLEGAHLLSIYGTTEAAGMAVRECPPGEELDGHPLGTPVPGCEIQLLGGGFEPVESREAGEIFVAGPSMARGYLKRPAWTAERFLPNPFSDQEGARLYRTGDLGRRRSGEIEFLGRADDQLKIRGLRVEPGEIEAALRRHPEVAEAVVLPHDGRLVAWAVPRGSGPLDVPALRELARETLPAHIVPAVWVALQALPLSPNGKIDRAALIAAAPTPARNERDALASFVAPYVAPRSVTEERLAELWRELFEIDRVGVDDDFFDLGGHSLLAIRALDRIEETFGRRIPQGALVESPTVAGLARWLGRDSRSGKASSGILVPPAAGGAPAALLPGPHRPRLGAALRPPGEEAGGRSAGLRSPGAGPGGRLYFLSPASRRWPAATATRSALTKGRAPICWGDSASAASSPSRSPASSASRARRSLCWRWSPSSCPSARSLRPLRSPTSGTAT